MCAAVESRSVDGIGAEIESAKTRNHLAADGSFFVRVCGAGRYAGGSLCMYRRQQTEPEERVMHKRRWIACHRSVYQI